MGYHTREIAKGVLGEASKVREEYEEFMDAIEQEDKVLQIFEAFEESIKTEASTKTTSARPPTRAARLLSEGAIVLFPLRLSMTTNDNTLTYCIICMYKVKCTIIQYSSLWAPSGPMI